MQSAMDIYYCGFVVGDHNMELAIGTYLNNGKYRIEKVLGQGSFGITYLATAKFTTNGNLGKMVVEAKVAIKVLGLFWD